MGIARKWVRNSASLRADDSSGRCIVHDVDTWKVLLEFHPHAGAVRGISPNPKHPSIATCGADGIIHVWRLTDGKKDFTLFGHDGAINDVDWDPSGQRLATGGSDQRVLIWDVHESPAFHRFSLGEAEVSAISWNAVSSQLNCTVKDGSTATIDIGTRKVVTIPPRQELLESVETDHQPKSATMKEYLTMSALNRTMKHKRFAFVQDQEVILWSKDGASVVVVSPRLAHWQRGPEPQDFRSLGGIELWNAHEKVRVFSTQLSRVEDAQWAPDDHRLAVAGNRQDSDGGALGWVGWVYIFDIKSTNKVLKMRLGSAREEATAIAWNPSGTRVVVGNLTGLACIWDAADGKLLKSLAVHQDRIRSIAWSPDAKRIASADDQGQVKILDAETLEELLTLSEKDLLTLSDGTGGVKQLTWSPDGRQLAGIHMIGNVVVWNATRGFVYSSSEAFKKRIASQNRIEANNWVNDLAKDHFSRAISLQKLGKWEEAISEYRESIRLEPDFVLAINNLAWQLATLSDTNLRDSEQALELALKAVQLSPENDSNLNTLGVAQYRDGRWMEAINSLEKSSS